MTIAGIVDYFGWGFTLVVLIGVPAAGLVVNIAGLQRHGLNRRAGIAACLFFLTLLVQGITVTLSGQNAFSDEAEFWLLASTGMANILGAVLALWALWQIRRRHRWPRGRKRAIAVFWLNVMFLGVMAVSFYLRLNPALRERLFGS
jgi:hypothetical protein